MSEPTPEAIVHTPESAMGDERPPLTGARYYDASKNPDGVFLPGVPLRDLEAAEFEALPLWLQYSVDAAPYYRKSKPATAKHEDSAP